MNKRIYLFIFWVCFLSSALKTSAIAQDLVRDNKVEKELVNLENKSNNSPFGVLEFLHWNHNWNNYKYPDQGSLRKAVALMKEAGVGWVRMDFLWEDIEPEKGKLNFEKYDYLVDLLTQNNIGILGLLSYSASWAGPAWNSPPYEDESFVSYASNVIGRYKDKVKYWEIWNEPDDEQYWKPQDGMARYTNLLKKVYLEAKQVSPDCKILNGGLSKAITLSLKMLYQNGAKGYFDILAIHPFVNPLNEVDVVRVKGLYNGCKKIMQDNGDDQKVWFTELGAPGVPSPSASNSWWLGMSPTEAQQAAWVKRIYTEILPELPDCQKVFWAFFRDCNNYWNNGIDYFGLVKWNFSKKPAFNAYKESAREWVESPRIQKPKEKLKGISPW
ncbi:MAG: beta-galactosidase [Candidatus Omnitrophica bacterium]|nr:beta-galactosidase [Candidatus Omnitrophota bacterium]